MAIKRNYEFTLPWLPNVCIVTASRNGVLYFCSGDDRYQMPLETFWSAANKKINESLEGMEGQEFP